MKNQKSIATNFLLFTFTFLFFSLNGFAQTPAAGSLDFSFDGDGFVKTQMGAVLSSANSMVVQSDGKIVVAGGAADFFGNGLATYDFAVARYNPNGSLDTTFDGDGKVKTPIGTKGDIPYSVAIQSDGKIVVAGLTENTTQDFAVVRYNTDGSLDTTFDGDGKVVTSIGTKNDPANYVTIQSDGKIVVAGFTTISDVLTYHIAIVRYNANGTLDTTFDSDGIVITQIGLRSIASSIKIQSDGKIVAVGYRLGSAYDLVVVRYNINGSLDASFDDDGIATTAFGIGLSVAESSAIQSDGKIIAAGYFNDNLRSYFAVVRYNTNGSLDTTFDGDGKLTTPIGSYDEGYSVAIQSDGKIVLSGQVTLSLTASIAVVRYNTNGTLDTSFDGDGVATTEFNVFNVNRAHATASQSDGKILVAGVGDFSEGFAIVRFNGGLAPTAAESSISGRVTTASGRGIRNVVIQINGGNLAEPKYARTNEFGYYRFTGLDAGQTYVLNVSSKRYSFANPTRVITLNEDLTDEDFVSEGK
jgi:uncharacterized delta-60 repeat protein